ncbi:MAG: hypothetical protein A2Z34_03085 [Planctomycetes bacterium RBG_16_59_8]|nr:MAG: hypothetical protein A2Z34_03085 [Planctomycetes bacterium RBG_16_59_8]
MLWTLLLLPWLAAAGWAQDGESLDSKDYVKVDILLSQEKVRPGDAFTIAVEIDIRPGYHLYGPVKDALTEFPTSLRPEAVKGLTFGEPRFPAPIEKIYEMLGGKLRLYEGKVTIFLPAQATDDLTPGTAATAILLTFQACTEDACRVPSVDLRYPFAIPVAPKGTPVTSTHAELFATAASATTAGSALAETLMNEGLLVALVSLFLGGLLSSLSPCVYPMIPITISFFLAQAGASRARTVLMALIYVLGITITYTSLGVAAALSGSVFGDLLGDPFVVTTIAVVLALLGLSMFGLYEFRLPSFITGGLSSAKQGFVGALVMGLLLGIVAAPCLGPILIGVLAYIGTTKDPYAGSLFMFVYALGLGLPFFVLALAPGVFPRSGRWMTVVKIVFGVVIFAVALNFLTAVFSMTIVSLLLGILSIVFAIYLFRLLKAEGLGRSARAVVGALAALSLAGGLFFSAGLAIGDEVGRPIPAKALASVLRITEKVTKVEEIERLLERAKGAKRPVVIDFGASWCAPCKEIEFGLLRRPDVAKELERFVVIMADVTERGGEAQKLMNGRYAIGGVPAIAFHNSDGTMHSVLNADFEKRLLDVLKSIQ